MDRTKFLADGKSGDVRFAGSTLVGYACVSTRSLGGADNQSAVASAMAHFGVTEADLKKVMAAALEKGGDYATSILSTRLIIVWF